MPIPFRPIIGLCACVLARPALAEEALVAVAASFLAPMQSIVADLERDTAHSVKLVSGSTGALYAQILNGAPFDVFVAADAERPRLLERAGLALQGSRATVAFGQLVLYSRHADLAAHLSLETLRSDGIGHIAIANPRVAPYGVAAQQTLEALGLWKRLQARIVRGESVAQTYAMIASGNADLGFVALAQLHDADQDGAYVLVPQADYAPIRQDVIVLARARDNAAARAVRDYLLSAAGQAVIRELGYATDTQ